MNSLEIFLKPWVKASTEAFCIRRAVFIEEQKVPEELELDEFDPLAINALAYRGKQCVGTARLIDLGNGQSQVGRMAVLAHFRGKGIGRQILARLVLMAKEKGFSSVALHSQVSAIPFYEKQGFIAQGPIYDEAGIAHRNMMLILPNSIK